MHWERTPTVFKSNPERKALLSGLFDIDSLRMLAKERFEAAEAAAEVGTSACCGASFSPPWYLLEPINAVYLCLVACMRV